MSSTTILAEQLREVAERRAQRDALAAEITIARANLEAALSPQIVQLRELQAATTASEDATRNLAVAIYATTGESKPIDGVQIKVSKVYVYDPGTALTWARETKMALLPESLDVKAFEKIAKATPLDFVTVRDEPKAQLATDLSAYLLANPTEEVEA